MGGQVSRDRMYETMTEAASDENDETQEWLGMDWPSAQREVRRLQARIVKATKEGRRRAVKSLQRLLTRSYAARALAVKRVTENKGKNTPGVDQVTWRTPRQKRLGMHSLRRRGYRPQPLRRIYILKKNGKKRPLGIPTMKDRAMQALYLQALAPVAECLADPHSYGFRPERSTADAMRHCHMALCKKRAAKWVLEGDIKSCFDRIDHGWLLRHIPMDREVLGKWLSAGYLEKHVYHPTEEGTPQGGVASPVLANLALDGLQKRLRKRFPPWSGAQVTLVRYADDFIITGRSRELLEEEVKPVVRAFLSERGLELSEEKTRVTHIEDGFDFLGQNVRKYKTGKCIIKPARKNVKDFLEKVRGIIKTNASIPAGQLVRMLNPLLKGWCNYHRHQCSKLTFKYVDHILFTWLQRWAKRRHTGKSRRWVKERYFGTVGGDHWRFFGRIATKDPETGVVQHVKVFLYNASATPIRRHISIRAEANPYDPVWEAYFEERQGLKMIGNPAGRRTLSYLWKQQNGNCPVCSRRITRLSGWHLHHKVWRTLGGTDRVANRVLLHPHCHEEAHAPKFSKTSPGPSRGLLKA